MVIKYKQYIKEALNSNQFFKNYKETKEWLDLMKIKNYNINSDLTIDVNGSVNISHKNLKYIPVKFNIVNGIFFCDVNYLTSLIGSPEKVSNDFYCSDNLLTSLNGLPNILEGNLECSNNLLTSLNGLPNILEGNLECSNNSLTSLNGLSKIVKKDIHCDNNLLISLDGLSIYNISKCLYKMWYFNLNSNIKEKWFNEHLYNNPEIIKLINFKITDEFK